MLCILNYEKEYYFYVNTDGRVSVALVDRILEKYRLLGDPWIHWKKYWTYRFNIKKDLTAKEDTVYLFTEFREKMEVGGDFMKHLKCWGRWRNLKPLQGFVAGMVERN